jgi:hypothetical protein
MACVLADALQLVWSQLLQFLPKGSPLRDQLLLHSTALPLAALRLPLQPSPVLLAGCAVVADVPLSETAAVYADYREHAVAKATGAVNALNVAGLICLEDLLLESDGSDELSPAAQAWLSSDVQQLLFAGLAFAAMQLHSQEQIADESSSSSQQQQQQQRVPVYHSLLLDTLGLSASDASHFSSDGDAPWQNAYDSLRVCLNASSLACCRMQQQQEQQMQQQQLQQEGTRRDTFLASTYSTDDGAA